DAADRQLPHRAHNFGVAGVTDEHDLTTPSIMNLSLAMDLGHQRAGRVDCEQITSRRLFRDSARDAVSGKDYRRVVIRNLAQLFDEERALGAQALDHVTVMHDLVTDIDRCPVDREGLFDRFNGAHDTRAETTG